MCSCRRCQPPRRTSSTRTWTRSSRRSSSATIRACGPAGGRRWGSGAGRELRGEGLRGQDRDAGWQGARAVSAHDRRAVALRGLLGGEQGGVRDLRRHVAGGRGDVDRRGVPGRARDAADRGCAGGDRRAVAGAGAREVGLPITVGVARTKFLAKVASGVAKPDGLLVVSRRTSWRSCIRCRWRSSGGSGSRRRTSCTRAGSRPWGRSRRYRDRAGRDARAGIGPAAARARAQP